MKLLLKRSTYLLLLLAASVLYVACSKEGPAGPAGPEGPTGANGANGAAGPAGPQGEPGTANVIYSEWLDVIFEPDTFTNTQLTPPRLDTFGYFANIEAAKLDANILNTGEIKVYVNMGTADEPNVVPLPYYDVYFNLNILVNLGVGNIALYSNGDVGTATDNGAKVFQYRYILIPGGTAARMAKSVNWNDYKAVKAYLKLKD